MIKLIVSAAIAALFVAALGLAGCGTARPSEHLTEKDRVQLNNLINRR